MGSNPISATSPGPVLINSFFPVNAGSPPGDFFLILKGKATLMEIKQLEMAQEKAAGDVLKKAMPELFLKREVEKIFNSALGSPLSPELIAELNKRLKNFLSDMEKEGILKEGTHGKVFVDYQRGSSYRESRNGEREYEIIRNDCLTICSYDDDGSQIQPHVLTLAKD